MVADDIAWAASVELSIQTLRTGHDPVVGVLVLLHFRVQGQCGETQRVFMNSADARTLASALVSTAAQADACARSETIH
jgi:hypothetical protein